MMPPTSIDGTDITGATIDGTDVQEITVDGQTVFTAVPTIIDDFEDGNINGWNHITDAGGTAEISNTGFNSNHSIRVGVGGSGAHSTAYFDSFGTVDFTNPFVLSAYLRLDTQNFSDSRGAFGYLFNTNDPQAVLVIGLDNRKDQFSMTFNGKFGNDPPEQVASTSFPSTSNQNVWFKVELEFDGTDHIGRLFDTSENLLETITWANSASNAQNSGYVAVVQSAAVSIPHGHFVDDIALD